MGAQGVAIDRELFPGMSGGVYVSPDLYDTGFIAADRLSITEKTIKIYLALQLDYVELDVDENDVEPAQPQRRDGRLVRKGGGAELHILGGVAVVDAPVLQLREP